MRPFYNLNRVAGVVFAIIPVAVMVTLYLRAPDFDRFVALGVSGADYMAGLLTLAALFLSAAAIEPWARLLSQDKARVGHTRKAALVGAAVCVGISCALLLFRQ